MDNRDTSTVLREVLREQICCLGRIVARHQVPDDVVWEIAKGFDVIYERARRQAEAVSGGMDGAPVPHRMEPHPGLTYLLEKLDAEAAAGTSETSRE